ncbi:MAG: DUF5684 domain-containing protein [Cytophagaceae bacterium]
MSDSTEIVYEEVTTYATDSMSYSNDSLQAALNAFNDPQMQESLGLLANIGMGLIVFVVALMVFMYICYWKIFVKAGHPGWASLVPLYNIYIYFKIINKPLWWIILLIIPFVNIFFIIKMTHALSKSFGKDVGFTIGLIFLPYVFIAILAFGDAKYVGAGGSASGALDSNI